jgi:hypothetical protein
MILLELYFKLLHFPILGLGLSSSIDLLVLLFIDPPLELGDVISQHLVLLVAVYQVPRDP